jgi:Tfp pilus assembly protein PilZ
MTKPVQHLEDFKLTNRVKGLLKEISVSIDTAPLEQKQALISLLEDWQHGHQRRHSRKACSLNIDYASDGYAFKGSIKNVGVEGLFIETTEKLSPGQTITLSFSLPNHPKPLKTAAKVVWHCANGVGVQFKLPNKYVEEFWKAKIEAL